MTVLADRTVMADQGNELDLDTMFEWLERMHVPEGFKTEIVEGAIFVTPQRDTHWDIIADIYDQLRAKYPRKCLKSDVRMQYPGHLNGFASDVVALAEGSEKDENGLWRPEDVEFIAEVISKDTAKNDYGPKKTAYAAAGVPVYLIVDPYTGMWHLHTLPKDGVYRSDLSLDFGDEIDLTGTPVGLVLKTDEFPRD
ncbi:MULTISPECIES: Uma2 family endonuclease [Streptomyces]|uniref:Uma2 family endonuclease n=1 Tax=Streptomyces TaxID=1883 RepID=UPI0003A33548|nr:MULTISPECIES: Uma2 family endonuclease [Streptomyces]MBY8865901.1 Uma2 family endonuclease [Streptomyces sennicomposti]MYS41397.1 Uma2 family endonuclease [Streptomyces sp. SID5998]MYX26510.1 Uma2 family endonuclease [Streptomyces sp. SID8381]